MDASTSQVFGWMKETMGTRALLESMKKYVEKPTGAPHGYHAAFLYNLETRDGMEGTLLEVKKYLAEHEHETEEEHEAEEEHEDYEDDHHEEEEAAEEDASPY